MNMLFLRHLITSVLDFLFPKSKAALDLEKLTPENISGLFPPTTKTPVGINSLYVYKHPMVHELLWEIKYHANAKLAALIAPAIINACAKIAPQGAVITFIPATQTRKEKRGFDQGALILDAMKKYTATLSHPHIFAYERDVLSWNRKVRQQSLTENKKERFENMKQAFTCLHPELIKSKTIIVLDDVTTTGATLIDAKRALEQSGAAAIYLLTIAH